MTADFLHFHLTKESIEKFISEHVEGFTENTFTIDVTWGGKNSRNLNVRQFTTNTLELLKENKQMVDGRLQVISSAPIGIYYTSDAELATHLKGSVKAALKPETFPRQISSGTTATLRERILATVARWHFSSDTPVYDLI
jgi:hypothetical protein